MPPNLSLLTAEISDRLICDTYIGELLLWHKWLADAGYDPVYGARPLKRVIQRSLQNELVELLLAGEVLDGAHVPVSAGEDGLITDDQPRAPKLATVH